MSSKRGLSYNLPRRTFLSNLKCSYAPCGHAVYSVAHPSICLVGLIVFCLRTCWRCSPFPSIPIHFQSGAGPVHNFYSTCLRGLVILRFSNLLAGPMVHTMLILGAISGQKQEQKETKTGVPATFGKNGFDMLFAMFHPCRASRHNHIFVVI